MSTTKTDHPKHEPAPRTQVPPAETRPRRTGVTAAVIAAVAAVVAVVLVAAAMLAGIGGDDGPATPGQAPTTDEQVAQDFLDAFTSFRPDLVALHLADDASLPEAWWRDLKRYEAMGVVFLVRPCEQVSASSAAGTSIMCTFDYHALGTDEEGRAPFGDNTFALRVDDGKVDHFEVTDSGAINGFDQRYDAFGSWVRTNHPGDWDFMDSDGTVSAEDLPRWLQLWKVRLAQYENRVASYVEATSGA
jgi:hypothetical protein